MAEINVTSLNSTGLEVPSFEALQNHTRDMRRARPPDITVLKSENRVPLRAEKLAKRESRLGLRNIFGKSKTGKDGGQTTTQGASPPQEPPRQGGIRTSLADLGNWPQRLQSSRSELSLLSSPPSSAGLAKVETPTLSRTRQDSLGAHRAKLRQSTVPKTIGPVTGFDPPPLFQMYPQAIKHATLPACVASIDGLFRRSETKSSSLSNGVSRVDLVQDHGDVTVFDRKGDTEKKKRAKFATEWTSKIYALVTSGYLLQYAAEGSFDRLPEKVLNLNRDSAAYASDLIPGKHWVVRVTSTTDAEGNPNSDSKSLRSKLAMRGIEKRQVSNMLLVFDNPGSMDSWLAILRREIESLGGKKKLSETGKPEVGANAATLRTQTSQRNLVTRDSARFSRIISRDFSWTQENALVDPTENDFVEHPLDRLSESTLDDGSSMVSSDGQRLDSLRDSGSNVSNNRLSYISSGQRTILSSAESSPTSSPIRASFSSMGDDYPTQTSLSVLPSVPEVQPQPRPRPNAAAIASRRQSIQKVIPGFDPRLDASSRPLPTTSASLSHGHVPNFSVPHTVNRRYSSLNFSTVASRADQPEGLDRDGPMKPFRKTPPTKPPTKLSISRPLSIVIDQPSPMSPVGSTNRIPVIKVPDSPSMFVPRTSNVPTLSPPGRIEVARSLIPSPQIKEGRPISRSVSPGYRVETSSRPRQRGGTYPRPETGKSYFVRPKRANTIELIEAPEQIRRAASSLEMRSLATPGLAQSLHKRTSLLAENPTPQNRNSIASPQQSSLASIEEPAYTLTPPQIFSPKRSVPSLKSTQHEASAKQFLAVNSSPKALLTRRSMPHLADGPPPAPPPTCALPPIPMKRPVNQPRSIRAQ
ncbi:uncharacterized protein GGS25DRAFT_520224 [Hypoxylon fragiforme]|uniref:uncharacterized protein n=1 Tax=Hypoxylon fragiforme TaxID=63214 RepID=UPI0020C64A3F|nr:uncharacterized protein GGS25DRAFT_520224 [Hypoxylon fragiforme]KAI2609430.1 hypothetical protein GGS25DRAFT_520224 [Hypoxylon fragiforme]